MSSTPHLLEVNNLRTSFFTSRGEVRAVDGVSFSLEAGKTLCIVGESGCGKSVTSLSLMRLIPQGAGRIVGGEILYNRPSGTLDLAKVPQEEMRQIRGREMAMVFQEPMTSLNPVFTVGSQVSEVLELHLKMSRKDARERTIELFKTVGIPAPEKRIDDYPHQLSGGMRQRVMIAMAIACQPKVLIADEPTTALDVTIQAQILDLLRDLQDKFGMALLLITHDLGVVAEMAQKVLVMYAGKAVEEASVEDLFKRPSHPYTRGLLNSLPSGKKRLEAIPGIVPDLLSLPHGCRFQDRCVHVVDACRGVEPEARLVGPDGSNAHHVRCIKNFEPGALI